MKKKARTRVARVRFTPEELAVIRQKAKAEGVPLSVYLRRLALTIHTEPERRRAQEERVRRTIAALKSLSLSDEEAKDMLELAARQ